MSDDVRCDRNPECVLDDVLDGLTSVATARRDFGTVLTPDMTIDLNQSAKHWYTVRHS